MPFAYYDDSSLPFGLRSQELVKEALEHLSDSGYDFSQLTFSDGQNADAVTVMFAGRTRNTKALGLWEHQYSLPKSVPLGQNMFANRYAVIGTGCGDRLLELGPYCHEMGHLLCQFPDLYDLETLQTGFGYGVGEYCLMGFGGEHSQGNARNPVQLCAYLKMKADWANTFEPLEPREAAYRAKAGTNDFYYYSKSLAEYFIIEHRQQTGRDANLPTSGLTIWHVDEYGCNSVEQGTPESHYECSLE